jgi:excisionase family DNA binding protein
MQLATTVRGGTVSGNTPALTNTRFLTVFEVAAIMRVSKQTVYRLVAAGDMEAIRVGGSYRIPEYVVNPDKKQG